MLKADCVERKLIVQIENEVETEKKNLRLNDFATEVYEVAKEHGWWEKEPTFPEFIALCHSELSEALEEYRKGRKSQEVYYETSSEILSVPHGVPYELADCVLRILDYCAYAGIDIEECLKIKNEYNKIRPYKHGGKVI